MSCPDTLAGCASPGLGAAMRRRRNLRRRSSHALSTCHVDAHSFGCKPRRCLGRPRKGQVLVAAPELPTTAIERSRRKSALAMSLPRRRRAARAVVWMLRFFFEVATSLPAGAIPLHSLDQHRNHAVMLQCIPQQVKTLADLPARSQEPVATLIFASESEQPALAWCCGRGWL